MGKVFTLFVKCLVKLLAPRKVNHGNGKEVVLYLSNIYSHVSYLPLAQSYYRAVPYKWKNVAFKV